MVLQVPPGLAIVACVSFYGVQFVPAKLHHTYNGAVFQWFMCSGGLFTGLVLGVLMVGDLPGGTVMGLISGFLVAISNTIILHLKRTLGLFTGVVVYQAANLTTGYCVGRFGLLGAPLDPGRIPLLRDVGIVLLLASLVLASKASKVGQRARAMSVLSDPLVELNEELATQDPEVFQLVMRESSFGNTSEIFLHLNALMSPIHRRPSVGGLSLLPSPLGSRAASRQVTLESGDLLRQLSDVSAAELSEQQQRRISWPMKAEEVASARPRLSSCPEARSKTESDEGPSSRSSRSVVESEEAGNEGRRETCAADAPPPAPQPAALELQRGLEGTLLPPAASSASSLPSCCEVNAAAAPVLALEAGKPALAAQLLGWLLALVAGFCRGLNPVPFSMWRRAHPEMQAAVFVFPHALGVWAAGTMIYLFYTCGKKVLQLPSPMKPNIRPAFISGCLWALGFAAFAEALDGLGYTATYTLSVIGPVFVSQLLSVFVFKEIQERSQLSIFFSCCFAPYAHHLRFWQS